MCLYFNYIISLKDLKLPVLDISIGLGMGPRDRAPASCAHYSRLTDLREILGVPHLHHRVDTELWNSQNVNLSFMYRDNCWGHRGPCIHTEALREPGTFIRQGCLLTGGDKIKHLPSIQKAETRFC